MTALVAVADAEYARALTDKIKVAVEGTWHLITEAYTSRAYTALGYANWDDYCTREFGTSRLRLPREERSEVVGSLRDAGLSIRAIAAATGLDKKTVNRDVQQLSQNGTPGLHDLDDVIEDLGIDLADDEPPLTQEECEALDAALSNADQAEEVERKTITGIDGKKYTSPPPNERKPNRRPLTDAARTAGWELRKAVEKVERLLADNRLSRNKEEVAAQLRSHLQFAIDSCQGFLDGLPTTEGEQS